MKFVETIALTFCVVLSCMTTLAKGSGTYHFTGKVTALTHDTVTVCRGNEYVEFSRPKGTSKIRVGEKVTVTYSVDAKQVSPAREAAGEAAPDSSPGPAEDTGKQRLILDDRAFYNAKNSHKPSPRKTG